VHDDAAPPGDVAYDPVPGGGLAAAGDVDHEVAVLADADPDLGLVQDPGLRLWGLFGGLARGWGGRRRGRRRLGFLAGHDVAVEDQVRLVQGQPVPDLAAGAVGLGEAQPVEVRVRVLAVSTSMTWVLVSSCLSWTGTPSALAPEQWLPTSVWMW